MIQLVYASAATVPFNADALRALLAGARAHNTSVNVSGLLLHVGGAFLQVLEGDPEPVNALYRRIAADPRHARVLTLLVSEIAARSFPDWSMGFFDASGRSREMLGYRATTGFADLIGDPATLLRIIGEFRDGRWRSLAA